MMTSIEETEEQVLNCINTQSLVKYNISIFINEQIAREYRKI